jgi:hypothetical protein
MKNPQCEYDDNLKNKEFHGNKIKMEDIVDVNGAKKNSKLDIKVFLARNRLSANKENKKY